MTSALGPISAPAAAGLAAEPQMLAPPRKRRRRTAAGGANDDCFACRKRSVACDRKRPYCTQCIEVGKDCSGYKTTLTWGVGVASRGKLRGLSCPVASKPLDPPRPNPNSAGTATATATANTTTTATDGRRRKSSAARIKKESGIGLPPSSLNILNAPAHLLGPTSAPSTNYPPQYSPTSLPPPVSQSLDGWQLPGFADRMQARQNHAPRHDSFHPLSLQRLQTAFVPPYEGSSAPNSGSSVASYPDSEYYSPMEFPHTPGSMVFPDHMVAPPPPPPPPPPIHTYGEPMLRNGSHDNFGMHRASVTSYPDPMSATVDGLSSVATFADPTNLSTGQLSPLDGMLYASDEVSFFDPFASDVADGDGVADDGTHMALIDTRFGNPFFHLSPRVQSLMDYYDQNICPFLVAFDGPENPYRKHILQLAMQNEGLQNAIAALSTNNLRMRRKQPKSIGFIEEITGAFGGLPTPDVNEPSAEESMYKQLSIDQLNLQLTDPGAAQDDSVLATLLILCLFHVCDSGFSKFKTQLAGVQKLLSLRHPGVQTDFTRWVDMFFTWFDVMTSTVNDREMQIKSESLDMLDFSANLGALEQFSGCDGRLFKLIARLGTLSLLAQGRPVRSNSGRVRNPRLSTVVERPLFPLSSSPPSKRKRPSTKFRANRSLVPDDYPAVDGHGWGSPILSSDEDADGSADGSADDEVAAPLLPPRDERREFWSEWRDVRTRLQAWRMEPCSPAPGGPDGAPPPPHDAGQRDLSHINESFRFSALLYTERLAHPLLPSSHPQFQRLVAHALAHIRALPVTSCVNKFLLWPLFITGTECVDESHRAVIRARCVEIQRESGFFNNLSGLDLLEKVWREVGSNVRGCEGEEVKARRRDSEAGRGVAGYGQAFRWRKAMDRVDGEYIVI